MKEFKSAGDAALAIRAAVPQITQVVALTEDNDPNELIGRTNGYVAATVLIDPRADDEMNHCEQDGLGASCGAMIEQWPSQKAAQARADYIRKTIDSQPMLKRWSDEYQVVRGPLLLRVAAHIKPSDEAIYAAVFNGKPAPVASSDVPTAVTSASPTYAGTYGDVADYMVAHGVPFSDTNDSIDGALGAICSAVDGKNMAGTLLSSLSDDLQSSGVVSGSDKAARQQALGIIQTAIDGCYATGHSAKPKPKPKPKPAPTISDGVWTVGLDVPPGTYRSDGDLSDCYWEISKTGSNGQDIVANDLPSGGHPEVTLSRGQDFSSDGCGTWKKD